MSVHVRRGDYVTDATTRAFHGLCPIDYYRRAAAYVSDRVRDPLFVLFSDDPEWTRTHLDLGGAHAIAIDHNGPDDGAEDLRLDEPLPPPRHRQQHVQLVGSVALH